MIRRSSSAPGPVGHCSALPDRSWGGMHSASNQSSGATMMWRYCTPGVKPRWPSVSGTGPPRRSSRAAIAAAATSESG